MIVAFALSPELPVKTYVYVPASVGALMDPVEKLPPPSACAVARVLPLRDNVTFSS